MEFVLTSPSVVEDYPQVHTTASIMADILISYLDYAILDDVPLVWYLDNKIDLPTDMAIDDPDLYEFVSQWNSMVDLSGGNESLQLLIYRDGNTIDVDEEDRGYEELNSYYRIDTHRSVNGVPDFNAPEIIVDREGLYTIFMCCNSMPYDCGGGGL